MLVLKILIKLFYTLNKTFLYSNKTPLGETGCLSNLYLLAVQAFSFLIHPPFLNTVSQDTFVTLSLTAQHLCDFQDIMPHHWSPHTSHLTLPREAEDFPRGGKYPKDVPLSTFLAYLQPVKPIILD